MSAIASQITSLTTIHLTVYSHADQWKHLSSASLAFVRGIHRSRTKGQWRGKCFHLMTSSWSLALSAAPPDIFGERAVRRPLKDVSLVVGLHKQLNKQLSHWQSRTSWRSCDFPVIFKNMVIFLIISKQIAKILISLESTILVIPSGIFPFFVKVDTKRSISHVKFHSVGYYYGSVGCSIKRPCTKGPTAQYLTTTQS